MITKKYVVKCETGLHARPASELVKLTQCFECKLNIMNTDNDMDADAKSIIEILSLGADKGANIIFKAEGPDESKAIEEIVSLLDSIVD